MPFLQLVLLLGLFCGWAVLAGFILSRVPVGHVPSQAFSGESRNPKAGC